MERIEVRDDLENQFNWSRIESTFRTIDGIETLNQRVTLYDNGIIIEEMYEDGVLRRKIKTDGDGSDDGVAPWSKVDEYFDRDGALIARYTDRDNGIFTYENFPIPGQLEWMQFEDDFDVMPWQTFYNFYDETGVIERVDVVYDDGSSKRQESVEGSLSEAILVDGFHNNHDWERSVTRYDDTGEISSIELTYDDGLQRLDNYEDGVRRRIEKTDGPDGTETDTQNWSSHVQVYDADGALLENALAYDDGTFLGDAYTDGVRTLRLQGDNPGGPEGGIHPWTRIGTSYSETDGTVLARSISYDDGTITTTAYQDGVLRTLQRTDAPTGDGIEDWSISITTYEDAKIAHQFLVFDDGAKQESTFENGKLISRLDEFNVRSIAPTQACFTEGGIDCSGQTPPAPLVQKREFIYDEDQRIAEIHTLFAIGDVKSVLFEDGKIAEQHIFDRLNYQPWEARKLIYDDAGQVSDVIDFFERDQIPSDFAAATVSPGFESPELSILARSFGSADPFEPFVADGDNPTAPSLDDFTGLPGIAAPPTVDTFTPGGTATAPTLDDFGGGGISVTGGSVTLTDTDLSDGSTPPSLDEFDGTQVSAGGGITLTGGGSPTVPSAMIVTENTEQLPEIFDFV